MKKLLVFLLPGLLMLGGCARHYVVKLSNGVQITTASKPRLKGSYYAFKDASGREQLIPQARVQEIEPASRAKDERSFFRSDSGGR